MAIVDKKAYNDILTSDDRVASLKGQPTGLSASKMTAKQRELLSALLESTPLLSPTTSPRRGWNR